MLSHCDGVHLDTRLDITHTRHLQSPTKQDNQAVPWLWWDFLFRTIYYIPGKAHLSLPCEGKASNVQHPDHMQQQFHHLQQQQRQQQGSPVEKRTLPCIVSSCTYRATTNHALKMHMTMNHPGVDRDELDSKIRQCPIAGCERSGMSMHGLKLHCIKVRTENSL